MRKRPEYDKKLIGKNLRRCRQAKDFSVEQVREYLRLGSVQAIYKWEEGASYPQTDTMFALMELYGIELRDLLYREGMKEVQAVNEDTYEVRLERQFCWEGHSLPLCQPYPLAGRMGIHVMRTRELYKDAKRCLMYYKHFNRSAA